MVTFILTPLCAVYTHFGVPQKPQKERQSPRCQNPQVANNPDLSARTRRALPALGGTWVARASGARFRPAAERGAGAPSASNRAQ